MELLNDECLDLLRQVPVGRIAVTVDALPLVFPINFAVVDSAIVFRTPTGTKLAAVTTSAVVAFEVDSYESHGRTGWSVVVQGMAAEVTDPASLRAVDSASLTRRRRRRSRCTDRTAGDQRPAVHQLTLFRASSVQ